MVLPLYVNGDMCRYLKNNPKVNPIHIVQSFIMYQDCNFTDTFIQGVGGACGLEYLHSLNIVNGDLKGVSP